MSDLTYCKYCSKPIIFLQTKKGAKMPCDSARVNYVPDPNGKDVIYDAIGERAIGWIMPAPADDTVKGYRPHWVTCTKVEAVRRANAMKKNKAQAKSALAQPEQTGQLEQMSLFPAERFKYKDAFNA